MSIRIVTDSGADLEASELKKHHITLVPLSLTIDKRVYTADEKFNKVDFFRLLEAAEVFPQTSQPAPSEFENVFETARQAGDEVIYISLSSALSGTHQSASVVKGLGEYENVHIVDSKTATLCQKLLVLEAAKLRDEGKNAQEIVSALESLRGRVRVWAGLDTLEYLRKGGRLGRAAASLGSLARITPVITVGREGTVQVTAKCVGKARAMKEIASLTANTPPEPGCPVWGVYSGTANNLEEFAEKLSFQGIQIPKDGRFCIGPIIGAHIGPGGFGIVYVEKE